MLITSRSMAIDSGKDSQELIFRRLADFFVLAASTEPIAVEGPTRTWLDSAAGRFELFERRVGPRPIDDEEAAPESVSAQPLKRNRLLIVKFPGAGGRAERATDHPAEAWPALDTVLWTLNPPGYGASPGRASLENLAAVAESALSAARESHSDRMILLCGNSLGNLPALYLAANHGQHISGLLLRNPPPLKEVVATKHPWWKTWGLAFFVSRAIPQPLCAIQNASRCHAPVLVVSCERDQVVPIQDQDLVVSQLNGPTRRLIAHQADHADPIPEQQLGEYREGLDWLLAQMQSHDSRAIDEMSAENSGEDRR